MSYDTFQLHVMMLRDRVRTEAFARAIQALVKPGDRVLDFGCGTGVLSVFAERAGAAHVYALERSRMLGAARRVFAANSCTRIEPIAGDGATVELPGPVDVIVSEWMGHFVFAEALMFEPLLRLRDTYLRPGGRMIPARCTFHATLVTDPTPFEELACLRARPYGIDFAEVAEAPLFQSHMIAFRRDQLMPQSVQIGALEMHSVRCLPDAMRGTIECDADRLTYGLCGWFAAELGAQDPPLSTGPFDPPTCWVQLFFPFERPLPVRAGEPATLEISVLSHPQRYHYAWSARVGREERRGDDILLEASLLR
jgi:type I protein arginine methyltransferase